MNRIQEIVKSAWDQVKSEFDMNTRTWVAGVLEGEYHEPTLNVVATLVKSAMSLKNAEGQADSYARKCADLEQKLVESEADARRVKEEREEIRAQWTTQNNCIRDKCGARGLETAQTAFDRHCRMAVETGQELYRVKEEFKNFADRHFRFKAAIGRELGIKGGVEGIDLVSSVAHCRAKADAKESYKRLATARRTRLDEIQAALEITEDCHVFRRIDDLMAANGIATNALEDIRNSTDCPDNRELVEWCGEMHDTNLEALGELLVIVHAVKSECETMEGFSPRDPMEAIRALGLRMRQGGKFTEENAKFRSALEFYANDFNHRAVDFLSSSPVERDAGSRAQKALGRLQTAGKNQIMVMGNAGLDLMHLFQKPEPFAPILKGPWIESDEHHDLHSQGSLVNQLLGFPVVIDPHAGDLMFFMANEPVKLFGDLDAIELADWTQRVRFAR